jgi:hypothetical protein
VPKLIASHPEIRGALWVAAAAVALAGFPAGCVDESEDPPVVDDDTGDDDTGDDDDVEVVPPATGPWLRQETAAPGSITFDEILYHPASDGDLEWLELHNPMVLDMDLSGWSLDGGVGLTFAEGTIMPAGGFLVVAADPALLEDETGFAEALGPYAGKLSNGGERIDLRNNSGRLIDTVEYGDDDPWPVQADGSGHSLAKIDPDAASDHAENWTASAEIGGTPGESNLLDPLGLPITQELVAMDATWSYDLSGDYPALDWAEPDLDDSGWDSGQAIFFAGGAQEDVEATAWVTADNYFALYLGHADGSDLRLVGQDSDGDWTTVAGFDLDVTPHDHLYLAAWEEPGDSGSPQMTIAEVELPVDVVGTDASSFEWVLGPFDACPGAVPPGSPPTGDAITSLVEDANTDGAWDLPAVEAERTSDPWGWAVSGSFTDAARFVWADTFDANSVTNADNTYALFRSLEPLNAPTGATELPVLPTTSTFRTYFFFDGDPASTDLVLECLVDDGAVFHLNGVEVLRQNMPNGPVDATTLAAAPVADPSEIYVDLSALALAVGFNVLAVEVHQAEPDDLDLTFGCALTAETWLSTVAPTVVLNEVAPAADSPLWAELLSVSAGTQDIDGLVLASSADGEFVLPAGELVPGGILALDDLDFAVAAGDVLFLYAADRSVLLDAVRVGEGLRGRASAGGPWRVPREATPGEPNLIDATEDVVIHEIQYHRAPLSQEGEPVVARSEEWIELYNRGTAEVDLGGWQIVDAVAYLFPPGTVLAPDSYLVVAGDAEALGADHPDVTVVGDFSGRLDNHSDRILLLDAAGNPADEVRYFDGGRWPSAADGGGSSLELRDPWADNAAAEAWAASDESLRSEWVSYSYRSVAEPSAVGPDGVWEELVLGMLDAGEVLIDDLSVVQDPDTNPVELLPDGTFDADAADWRLLGNHRHGEIVPDPDAPANPVLRLVATGPTGHMHNHAETTLLQPIGTGEYEISFLARWISGSNQLNTRLYFNRLPRTTLVAQPDLSGTPGGRNSTAQDNLGPTFADLRQDVAVPAPHQPVLVSISVDDPDGVEWVTLWSSVDGTTFEDQAMAEGEPGRWEAELAGDEAGTIVQIYVEAEDGLGVLSTFPAAGPDSRALIAIDDGLAATSGLHDLRILMTRADSDWLHDDVNLMSNDRVGATVVYGEAEVFYDVGVRVKGSERGRPQEVRLGYGVEFHAEQPFRGSHSSVLIDRSEGVGFGQREVLLNLVMTRAGSVSGEYNDLVHLMAPRSVYTGPAELQLDRFSDLMLAAQFTDGDRGRLFEYELVYYPLSTDDGTATGLKLPQPDSVLGTSITDLGDDKEAYRWTFLSKNNRREDDYDGLVELCQTFALTGPDFLDQVDAVIDVDQWLRAFALATLSGTVDQYGGAGSQHNAQFYFRPEDQQALYFPHDLDFFGSSSMAVVGNSDLERLIEDPVHLRSYYGHLQDIIDRAYNEDYLAPWCDQLGDLLPEQDIEASCQFIADRAAWTLYDSPDAGSVVYPWLEFHIATGGGADLAVASTEVSLEGEAWIDVRQIALDGSATPLDVTWVDDLTWQVIVPLDHGPNDVTLVATDLQGEVVGTDSIVVTSTAGS